MKVSHLLVIPAVLTAAIALSGCGRNIEAGTYASGHVGESMNSYPGTIISKRTVNVADSEKLQDNVLGGAAGGVAGGLLGHMAGKGRGNTLATLGGAAAGAVAGAYAQKALSDQTGNEYTIQLDTGPMKTVVQGLDVNLSVGQRVMLHEGYKGRSRVVPFNG